MKSTMTLGLAAALGLMLAGPASADGFYAGAGLSSNDYTPEGSDFDNPVGYQLFGGYDLGPIFGTERLGLRLEGGFFSSGEFEADTSLGTVTRDAVEGVWASAVLDFALTRNFSIFGRGGFDGGDDDGPLVGVGAALDFADRYRLSGELVGRDNVDSFQVNFSVGF